MDFEFFCFDFYVKADIKRGSISAGSSWASSPGSTNASTPSIIDVESSKKVKKVF